MQPGRVIACQDVSCDRLWAEAALGGRSNSSETLREISGKVLTVAFEILVPYLTVSRKGDNTNLSGYLGDLWTILEQTLGFSSEYVRVDGHTARYMLRRGLADVYLQATVVTSGEDALYSHSQPVVTHWYQLYVRTGSTEVSADSYARALTPAMWGMTLGVMVLMCVVLRALVWLRCRLGMGPGVDSDATSLGSCFLSVLGGLCSQGWQDSPRCSSVRVASMASLLFGYLLYNAYAAVLISLLASAPAAPFSSLKELAKKGSHVLCVRNESYGYTTLRTDSRYARLLNKGPCSEASRTDQLVDGMCEHNAAALEISSVMAAALDMDERTDCRDEVVRVRERTYRATASLLLRKNFPFTSALDYTITRCRTSGVLDALEKRYLSGLVVQRLEGRTPITSITQVSLEHIRWVLLVYWCCMSVAVLVLAAECVVAWRARRRRLRAAKLRAASGRRECLRRKDPARRRARFLDQRQLWSLLGGEGVPFEWRP